MDGQVVTRLHLHLLMIQEYMTFKVFDFLELLLANGAGMCFSFGLSNEKNAFLLAIPHMVFQLPKSMLIDAACRAVECDYLPFRDRNGR